MAYDSKWWGMRSGDLVGSNTITQEISDSIKKFFSKKDGKAGNIFLVLLALAAFAFCLSGYTMILWKYMPESKAVRIILSLIPMAAGFFLFYKAFFSKFDSKVYMESAAALCIILTGYSLFHLSMNLGFMSGTKFMVYWMIFAIPVIYLATSTVGAFMYLLVLLTWLGGTDILFSLYEIIGMTMMSAMMGGGPDVGSLMTGAAFHPGENIFGWFFILLILPHFMRYTDRPSYDTRKLFLGWAGGIILMHCAMNSFTGFGAIAGPSLMICFYMAGKEYFADGKFWWNRPFQTLTIIAVVIGSWSLNFAGSHASLVAASGLGDIESPNGWFAYIINLLVVLGVVAWAGYTIYNDYMGEKKANIILVAYPALVILCILIGKSGEYTAGAWLFSLYTLGLGADYIMKGLKSKEYQLVALGTIIALPIFIYRVLDILKDALAGENGAVVLGLVLILIGGMLLYLGHTHYTATNSNEE